ncbi:NUDIX hydrolase [Micromonospora sp. SH-82]|uniref:NUDIX hydrolase n=1 Tax=Micromonospora sp. SH-82 TaxID=3132938 RepID=UPI003EBCBB23
MTVFTPRRAGRVLLVDATGRVLLFTGFDPARPGHRYWFTPGGGLDPGETPADGAARELAEETGLRMTPGELGEPVWSETVEFPFDGVWYRQEQHFFLVRVSTWEVDTAGFGAIERATVTGHRWWPVTELSTCGELCYPQELPTLLTRLLAGTDPSAGPAGSDSCVGPAGTDPSAGPAGTPGAGARC